MALWLQMYRTVKNTDRPPASSAEPGHSDGFDNGSAGELSDDNLLDLSSRGCQSSVHQGRLAVNQDADPCTLWSNSSRWCGRPGISSGSVTMISLYLLPGRWISIARIMLDYARSPYNHIDFQLVRTNVCLSLWHSHPFLPSLSAGFSPSLSLGTIGTWNYALVPSAQVQTGNDHMTVQWSLVGSLNNKSDLIQSTILVRDLPK